MRRVGTLAVAAAALLGAWGGRSALDRMASQDAGDRPLLYLPNGKHLRAASLGHAPLAADLVYLWAIQHYSDYRRADRFRYVEQVFGQVIAELDPHYADPYWLGALILIVEAHDLEGGLRLLDLGFERNPDQWVLPYSAAWECAHAGHFERAATYFGRAARVPGAPAFVTRMRAGMFERSGRLDEALSAWREVLADPSAGAAAHAIAERQVSSLATRLAVREASEALASFRARFGRPAASLDDLVRAGILDRLPTDTRGNPLGYDPATGAVGAGNGPIVAAP